MKKFIIITVLSFISFIIIYCIVTSCCGIHTEIVYSYKGAIIKRIDVCGKSTFYYNKVDKNSCKIWAEYSGINDGFSGYLVFNDNGKVFLLSGDGYFQTANPDTSKFEFKEVLAGNVPVGKNVYYILYPPQVEKEKNLKSGTGVKVKYNIDNNEWW